MGLKKYKGFIFDLNGTMVDDMQYHINAWHRIVNNLGANLTLDEVKAECYGKNNELLERVFPGRFTAAEKDKLGYEKEQQYQQDFKPHLKLVNGLSQFLKQAHHTGIKNSIGSAAIMFNIDFVLDGLNIRQYFDAVISADDVAVSKPHPETFLNCAKAMGLAPQDCIVFEDVPKGAEAAMNANMDCVVISTMHTKEEFVTYKNVISFIKDFQDDFCKLLL